MPHVTFDAFYVNELFVYVTVIVSLTPSTVANKDNKVITGLDCNKTNWHSSMHYSDVIMGPMASQITGISVVYSTDCSGGHQRKHQSSSSLAFMREIHRSPVNSPHKRPLTRENVSIWWRHHGFTLSPIRSYIHTSWNWYPLYITHSLIFNTSNVKKYSLWS